MTASEELTQIANSLRTLAPAAFGRLHRLAYDVGKMERALDEMVADAQQIEKLSRGLQPIGRYTETLMERALRLSSQEKP